MSTNEVPRYEWRYMPQSNCMDEADGSLRDSILRYELALVLAYAHEESVVVRMYNPEPDKNPEAQRLLNTSLVNETLKRAFATPGGAMHAMAAHVLFEHQVRTAPAPREQLLLEAAPPRFDNKLIEDILAPGLGWLVWRWQFEALASAAGCSQHLARELAQSWTSRYPRSRALLDSILVSRQSLWSIANAAGRWNGSTGVLADMAAPRTLLASFRERGLLRQQRQHKQRCSMTDVSSIHEAFTAAWETATTAYQRGVVNTECTLHSLMYSELRRLFTEGDILCEPQIIVENRGCYVPDIIVVKNNELVAIAEFKFVPHLFPVYENDLNKLRCIANEMPISHPYLTPGTGKCANIEVTTSPDCILVFGVIGRQDAEAVDKSTLDKYMGELERRFLPLIHKVPGAAS